MTFTPKIEKKIELKEQKKQRKQRYQIKKIQRKGSTKAGKFTARNIFCQIKRRKEKKKKREPNLDNICFAPKIAFLQD